MTKVQVLKCRPKMKYPILAWLIMLFQGMKPWDRKSWSHMAIKYLGSYSFQRVSDASGKTLRSRDIDKFLKEYEIVGAYTVEVNVKAGHFESWVQGMEGIKYDYQQLFGIALRILGFLSVNTMGKDYKRMTCNEFIMKMYDRFGRLGEVIGDPDNYDLLKTEEFVKANLRIGF